MKNSIRDLFCSGLLLSSFVWVASSSAQAFEGRRGHPNEHWHTGHWVHDRHGGRLGWWWVAGPSWSYFPRPVFEVAPRTVVIEQPPQVVVQAPPPEPVLYYCKATGTDYPQTLSCPGGWSPHTLGTPPQ